MPSLRNSYLNPYIDYRIWNWATIPGNDVISRYHDLRWTNWSSHDPYFLYTFLHFTTEGHYKLDWGLTWQSCDEYALSNHYLRADIIYNSSSWSTSFTIKNSAPKVDLIAATANKSCPGEYGVAINVTDRAMHVPMWVRWSGGDSTDDTCVVVDSSTPTPTPDPCRVKIDSSVTASMEASLRARLCDKLRTVNPPDDCPDDNKNAAQQLAIFGVTSLFAALGALGFFLM